MLKRRLCFADVETTGLNENAPGACILEVGLLVVDVPTFEPVAAFSEVVVPPCWQTVKRNLPEKVAAMHIKSDLVRNLDDAERTGEYRLEDVQRRAAAFVQKWAPRTLDWHTPMAGANPSFDRRWIEKHMPELGKKFHYRHFEVRTISFLQEWVFGEALVESPHRALDDCKQALRSVRAFLGLTEPPQPE
jgi:oligoribonuclease